MKLYLASYSIPTLEDLYLLIGARKASIKVGLIANAKDYYAPRARKVKVKGIHQFLESLGFIVSEIDLRDYNNGERLKQRLLKFDLLWITGGNSFCLRYEMKRSRFDYVVRDVLESGVVYGGDSAGAVVAGSDLRGIELVDIPEFAEEVIFDGIGLVPHFILPHVGSNEVGGTIDRIASQRANDNSLIKLTDSEALIIEDNILKVVNKD